MKKKLRLFIDGFPLVEDHFSGVGHYMQGIVRAIDDLLVDMPDVEATIIVSTRRKDRLQKYNFQNIKIKTYPVPHRIFRRLLVKGWIKVPMDFFFGKGVYFSGDFVTWPLSRSSSITTIHDISFEKVRQFVDPVNAAFLSKAARVAAEKCAYIATVTKTMKKEIEEFYDLPSDKVIVTYNAADLSHFYKRSEKEIDEVKRRYGIYGKYIICLGNIEPRKNQIGLLRAFTKLPRSITDEYTLLFVGAGGWLNDEIRDTVDKAVKDGYKVQIVQGKVTDADLPAVMSGAHFMAYASFYEGFGMPIVEAMGCQIPVVVSGNSVMPEVAGGAAILFDPYNDDDIAKALKKAFTMSEKERTEVIKKGSERVRVYDWHEIAGTLIGYAKKAANKEQA